MSVPGATQPVEDASAEGASGSAATESDGSAEGDPAAGDGATGSGTGLATEEDSSPGGDPAAEDGTTVGYDPAEDENQGSYEQQGAYEQAAYDEPGTYQEYEQDAGERGPLSALAVATLVTGLLALVPLALGLGIVALAVIRRTGKRGARLAVAGIYAAWIWLLVGAAVAALAYFTHGFRPRERVQYRPAPAYHLQPGECLNGDPNATSFSTISCKATHQAEVYGRFKLSGTAAYPGVTQVRQDAAQGCASQLAGYADPRLASIGFSQEYVYPDQPAWAAGERTVICMARFGSGIAGSIRKA